MFYDFWSNAAYTQLFKIIFLLFFCQYLYSLRFFNSKVISNFYDGWNWMKWIYYKVKSKYSSPYYLQFPLEIYDGAIHNLIKKINWIVKYNYFQEIVDKNINYNSSIISKDFSSIFYFISIIHWSSTHFFLILK